MYVEVHNEHEKYNEFIQYVLKMCQNAKIRKYETTSYIETGDTRLIIMFSAINHDVVMRFADFPLSLFGSIYEL